MQLNTNQANLFERVAEQNGPLAALMRPQNIDDIVGQEHLLGQHGLIRQVISSKKAPSMILWGPPGCGKTTLAEIVCASLGGDFVKLSAVLCGVKEVREVAAQASHKRQSTALRTYLFIDEIHRFNRGQQDALLPHVENGTLILFGATTENPSFSINSPLLSRCRVVVLKSLDAQHLDRLIDKACLRLGCSAQEEARQLLLLAASGDARILLTVMEIASHLAQAENLSTLEGRHIEQAAGKRAPRYDRAGDMHYDVKSALIKSMRGSDPDAAVHYLARMLEAGEEPRIIVRHLIVFACEDIGNADPRALQVATSALQAFEFIGMPEGYLPLTQAVIYLACAPKSNAVIKAYQSAAEDLANNIDLAVPLHLRNAATALAKQLGHGKNYQCPHDFPGNYVDETYLPQELVHKKYYYPTQNGYEKIIHERILGLRQKKN